MSLSCRIHSWAGFALLAGALCVVSPPAPAGELGPDLKQALVSAGPESWVPIVVMMEEFPDRDQRLRELRGLSRRERRSRAVADAKLLADRSQRPVRVLLEAQKADVRRLRVLWGINGLALEVRPKLIDRLAALREVRWVLHDADGGGQPANGRRQSEAGGLPTTGPTGGDTSGPNPAATVAPEVVAMEAQQVWDTLGYTGAGVIVAVIDTGVDRTHPDLADHMWTNLDELPGNGVDDDGNGYVDDTWGWDYCGPDNDPSDTGSHGTQVAGQVAGDGTNGTVTGMAPDAEIMAIGISCGVPDSIAWESSDYAIDNGADVINMSFVWRWVFQPDFEAFRRQSDTELAAGVIRINAAGNDGDDLAGLPIPYNVAAPANSPPPWLHPDQNPAGGISSTIAVGAISYFSDQIASYSSLGPSAWEDIRVHTDPAYPWTMAPEYQDYPYENGAQPGLLKPDISAYSDGSLTTCPGGSYCQFNGTSSASPHVAGVVALMLHANPESTPAELTQALFAAAEHRGTPGKNNSYGVGLVQAFDAVAQVESGVLYDSHQLDDTVGGNGDLALDPGETHVMAITVRSVTDDAPVTGLEAILSTTTPGVTIHDHRATYPVVPALGTATSNAPHYSLSIDPALCTTVVEFALELRFEGKVRRSTFKMRVGDETALDLLAEDFESDSGWSTDDGTATQGYWVREDPIEVLDGSGQPSNPGDDTSPAGVACFVTGNGELNGRKDEDNNDVDGGEVTLLSPPFGSLHMLSLDLAYDRWYYDPSGPAADRMLTEFSTDGGVTWALVEEQTFGSGGWQGRAANLFALSPPTDDMRLRFRVSDGVDDSPVEAAVDEVVVSGIWVDCQDHQPGPADAPNPVGATLEVATDAGGHTVLSWVAPAVDPGHDAATLYRIQRGPTAQGPFTEVGSATSTSWVDVDALLTGEPYFYRVVAENAGGTE